MRGIRGSGFGFGWAVLAVALVAGPASADESVYKKGLPSAAWVISPTKDGAFEGTGVLVEARRGRVLTAYHVVQDRRDAVVYFPARDLKGELRADPDFYARHPDERGARGQVVAVDPEHDLAVIQLERVPTSAREIVLAKGSPEPGQRLIGIGNSGSSDGVLWRYFEGQVRQVYLKTMTYATGQKVEARIVEMTLPFNGGDSGGPIVNARGELVAIVAGHHSKDNAVAWGIDVEEIRAMLEKALPGIDGPDLVAQEDAPAAPVAAAPVARIVRSSIDRDVVREGRKGIMARLSFEIDGARDLPCDVMALVYERADKPLMAKDRERAAIHGILGDSVRVTPRSDHELFRDVTLFVPYEAINASVPFRMGEMFEPAGAGPWPMDLGCALHVLDVRGKRWLVANPTLDPLRLERSKDGQGAGIIAPGR